MNDRFSVATFDDTGGYFESFQLDNASLGKLSYSHTLMGNLWKPEG